MIKSQLITPQNFSAKNLVKICLQEAKKKAAGAMLDKLISAGASGAHALVFAGTGNGWNGNLSEQPQQLKEDDLSDLKVETLTPRHSKTIQQFYKNLDLQVFAIIKLPLEAFS